MIHKTLSLILIIVYFSGLLAPFYPYAAYYLNYGYITRNLCEKRMEAANHCDGCCQLKEQIRKETKKTDDAESGGKERIPATSRELGEHTVSRFGDIPIPSAATYRVLNTMFNTLACYQRPLTPPPEPAA